MKFLWTKNNRFKGADIITYFLREPVSHFGILFSNNQVCHWSFSGFKSESYEAFTKRREVVFTMDYSILTDKEELQVYDNITKLHRNSLYDYAYVIWLAYRAALLFFFNRKIPYGEPWGDTTNNMICHEGLEGLPKHTRPKYNRDKANTPYRLYLELKKHKGIE